MNPGSSDAAVVFIVTLGMVYEVIAAACSSPQTAEINADRRAGTLMKWVHIGMIQAAAFVAIEALILHQHHKSVWPAVTGGVIGMTALEAQYVHARHAGLASAAQGTED